MVRMANPQEGVFAGASIGYYGNRELQTVLPEHRPGDPVDHVEAAQAVDRVLPEPRVVVGAAPARDHREDADVVVRAFVRVRLPQRFEERGLLVAHGRSSITRSARCLARPIHGSSTSSATTSPSASHVTRRGPSTPSVWIVRGATEDRKSVV